MLRADIAILTVIPEEYEAVIASLSFHGCKTEHSPGSSTIPNQFGWVTGELRGAGDQVYRIVVGMVAQPGPARMASAISATCARYKPQYSLVVGIAGGFPQDGQAKGDVAISSVIYDYDYGKVAASFQPRMDFTYQPDQTLLTSAVSLHARDKSWAERDKHLRPDDSNAVPKLLPGAVASGGKVVDDAGNEFFAAVLQAWPKLLAVEMEGAGGAAAIETAKAAKQNVGFLMVRGISDMPKMEADTQPTAADTQPTAADAQPTAAPPEGNKAERDKWKKYAATTAANFTIHWISQAWPLAPRPTKRSGSSAPCEDMDEDDPPPAKELAGLSMDIGVVREPPLQIDPSETFTDDRVLRYRLTKEKGEEEVTVISPQMAYLSQLGKSPIEAIPFFYNPFKCDYPSLDVTFVNNTGETLAIREAVFEVAESVPDITPVIVFQDNNAKMKLSIDNEGWGTVCNAVIRCNILPTGETDARPDPPISHISVASPYSHEFPLPDFEETATLDLADTFAKLGVDVKTIQATRALGQQPCVMHAMQNGLDVNLWQHYGRFPALETGEAWAPFPDGYAIVAGTLDCQDEVGTAYAVPFRVRVFLFQHKYTLPMPPSYTYNVMLEPEGRNYEIACQVVHSLKNREADRIHIHVGCLRSATHKFRIKWRLSGGKELVSGPIALRHFVPRRWAKKRRNRAEVGQEEQVQPPVPKAQMGCVEASIRTMLGIQAAGRNVAQQKVGYFAYGSNMYLPWLQKKANSARYVAVIEIRGYMMKFNKLGKDGSAKCNLVHTGNDGDTAIGVIFELTVEDIERLHEAEKGYERTAIWVDGPEGRVSLLTYLATGANTAEGLQPFTWYKNYVLEGAKMFKLPQAYIDSVIVPVQAKEAPEPAE